MGRHFERHCLPPSLKPKSYKHQRRGPISPCPPLRCKTVKECDKNRSRNMNPCQNSILDKEAKGFFGHIKPTTLVQSVEKGQTSKTTYVTHSSGGRVCESLNRLLLQGPPTTFHPLSKPNSFRTSYQNGRASVSPMATTPTQLAPRQLP